MILAMTILFDLVTLALLAIAARLLITYVRHDDFNPSRPHPTNPHYPRPYTVDANGIPFFNPR